MRVGQGIAAACLACTALVSTTAAESRRVLTSLTPEAVRAIAAALPSQPRARPAAARRLLVFYRTDGYSHRSIPHANEALMRMGERTGAYTAELSEDVAILTPERLARYDAIILNNTTKLQLAEAARATLLEFVVQKGKGLIGIHAASDNFYDWPAGQALLGGRFQSHPWNSHDTVAVKVDDPRHPVAVMFDGAGFRIRDEIYQIVGDYSREHQRVLLSVDMARPENARPPGEIIRTDGDFPIAWIKRAGLGRVFYSSLGHNEEIYRTPQVLEHYLAGIQFALGDLSADARPSAALEPQPLPALAPVSGRELKPHPHGDSASAPASASANAWPDRPDRVIVSADRLRVEDASITRVSIDEGMPAANQTLAATTAQVANFNIAGGGAGSFGDLLSYRGLANTPYFSDPAVTVYFDDLPLASSFTYPTVLFGFCDALVARGPQGSAFGRAGQGGVISFLSADPGASAGAELRTAVGSLEARSIALSAHTARAERDVGSSFEATVNAAHQRREGFIRNRELDARVDDQDRTAASLRTRWLIGESAEIAVQGLANRQRNGAQPLVPLGSYYTVERDRDGSTDIDFKGFALKGGVDTAVGRLTSVTSHTDWQLNPYDNRLVLPPSLDSRIAQRQRNWNEEIRLTSATEETGAAETATSPVRWSVGAWLSEGETAGDVDRSLPGLFPIESSTFDLDTSTAALFAESSLPIARAFTVTAGLRLERTEREFFRVNRLNPAPRPFEASRAFDAVLPKLAVAYELSADMTLSATLSRGTKPGGWSAFTDNETLAPFDPELATAFEVGLRSRLIDGSLTLATRAFAYRIRDYQIERSFSATDYLVVNAPRARSWGAELEAHWQPTESLTFVASAGATEVTLREFTDPFTGTSYAGNRAPYAPEYDLNLSATWRSADWFAAGEVASTGRTSFDESENPLFTQRSYTTFSARAGYETPRWRVTLYGDNLTGERYYSLIVPGVLHATPAAPRTWGLELSVRTGR